MDISEWPQLNGNVLLYVTGHFNIKSSIIHFKYIIYTNKVMLLAAKKPKYTDLLEYSKLALEDKKRN